MRKLGTDLELMIAKLTGDDEQARINLRARQVRDRYKQALETVYKEQAALFLAHTNNVYIMVKDEVKTLIVYVDDSIFAAELNAQRELIRLKLLELFGEQVEQFEIHVSRGKWKGNHPYVLNETSAESARPEPVPLDAEEEQRVLQTASKIDHDKIRNALKSAMTADMQLKKAHNDQYPNN